MKGFIVLVSVWTQLNLGKGIEQHMWATVFLQQGWSSFKTMVCLGLSNTTLMGRQKISVIDHLAGLVKRTTHGQTWNQRIHWFPGGLEKVSDLIMFTTAVNETMMSSTRTLLFSSYSVLTIRSAGMMLLLLFVWVPVCSFTMFSVYRGVGIAQWLESWTHGRGFEFGQ